MSRSHLSIGRSWYWTQGITHGRKFSITEPHFNLSWSEPCPTETNDSNSWHFASNFVYFSPSSTWFYRKKKILMRPGLFNKIKYIIHFWSPIIMIAGTLSTKKNNKSKHKTYVLWYSTVNNFNYCSLCLLYIKSPFCYLYQNFS